MQFQDCFSQFQNNTTLREIYGYHGDVFGYHPNDIYITKHGCKVVCGSSPELYAWKDSSQAITTWVLPMLGMLLSAPFVSNDFRNTIMSIFRWVGSPVMSLTHTLWNIEMSSRCCQLIDMSVAYDDFPEKDSRFGKFRDSIYLLSLLNQYQFEEVDDQDRRLLRVALFSDVPAPNSGKSLCEMRTSLAQTSRSSRRRGVVMSLISSFWFLFSVGTTIEAGKVHLLRILSALIRYVAYTSIGKTVIAHNMALSFLLTWFPILVLLTVVDRSSAGEIEIVDPINEIISICRSYLSQPEFRCALAQSCGKAASKFEFSPSFLSSEVSYFQLFAGQGRQRWFYGTVHQIIDESETEYIAEAGRGWLLSETKSTSALLSPQPGTRRTHFDLEALAEFITALVIVFGCIISATLISYYTPTVGLGCRSGGYMVFGFVTCILTVVELLFWRCTEHRKALRKCVDVFLALGEMFNTLWVIWISLAQTLGIYETCDCRSSHWILPNAYINMTEQDTSPEAEIFGYWLTGTIISCLILATNCIFMVDEWCEQSHMSTSDYKQALHGLKSTRRWRRFTWCVRCGPEHLDRLLRWMVATLRGHKPRRRTLIWSKRLHTTGAEVAEVAEVAELEPGEVHTTSRRDSGTVVRL